MAITNGSPGPPQLVAGAFFLTGVACASTTVCYAVGDSLIVPITNGVAGAPVSMSVAFNDVACASPTACVAVGLGGGVPISNGTIGNPVAYPGFGNAELSAVTCPDSSGCTAYGISSSLLCVPHFPCATFYQLNAVKIGADASFVSGTAASGIDGIGDASCPGTSTCYQGVTSGGHSLIMNWPTSNGSIIQGAVYAFGIDCTSTSKCVGVGSVPVNGGSDGAVVGIQNGQPSIPILVAGVSGGNAGLSRVSCPTATSCYAVGHTIVNGSEEGVFVALRPPSTSVLIPPNNATLSGTQLLDAAASDAAGVTGVEFHATGGTLTDALVASATPTLFGWLGGWDTTSAPNGTYTLESVATDVEGFTTHSAGITVSVNNAPPLALVGLPPSGAVVKGGQWLDSWASPGVTKVTYEISAGSLTNAVIGTAVPTYVGWLAGWNSTSVPNGNYTLNAVASYAGGVSGTSPGVPITVSN